MQLYSYRFLILMVLMAIALTACSGQAAATLPSSNEVDSTPTMAAAAPTATKGAVQAASSEAPTETPTQAPAEGAAAGDTVSFSQDVLPIFNDTCTQCHGTTRQRAGLALHSYQAVMAGADGEAVVIPNDAASSKLVEMITSGEMPKDDPMLSDSAIQIIREWIDQGAPDN